MISHRTGLTGPMGIHGIPFIHHASGIWSLPLTKRIRAAFITVLENAEIFRSVYKPNEEYLEIASRKYIPPEIRNIFIRDVTAEYMPTLDVQINLKQAYPTISIRLLQSTAVRIGNRFIGEKCPVGM